MKNAFLKSSFKGIYNSFARWLAILGIIALGVGFFSGLKVCKSSFWHTGDVFLNGSNFYDYRLVSTLGLDEESLKTVRLCEDLTYVEPSFFTDASIFLSDTSNINQKDISGSELTVKVHSITKDINKLELIEGSMPSCAEECVVDSTRYSKSDIGKYIILSSSNDEDTEDMFRYKKFKITGLVESPLYLNFERGTTSLGDGTVHSFVYLPFDAFNHKTYTEIYVFKENMGKIFSKEYKTNAKELKAPLKKALEKAVEARYLKILKEGQKKIDRNQAKLDKNKKKFLDAKSKLASGENKLKKAKAELKDKEAQVKEGDKKLLKGKEEIASAKSQLEEGYEKLKQAQEQLDTKEREAYTLLKPLEDALALGEQNPNYQQTLRQYEDAKAGIESQFAPAKEELEAKKKELDANFQTLKKQEKELIKQEALLKEAKLKIEKGKKEILKKEKELLEGKQEVNKSAKKLEDAQDKLNKAQDELDKINNPDNFVLDRSTNIGYVCFENDTSIVNGIAKIFPIFFILVAALVVMTTMTRMMEEERTQIGVLKALGYNKLRILNKYLLYSGSASFIGGVLGFLGGIQLFPHSIWKAYGIMYHFSPLILDVRPWIGVLSIASGVICATGTTVYSCYSELKEVPAELIRPKAPTMGKRILLERIKFIWNRLSFLHKVTSRNIFRYKKRFFMMILGVSGCTALLLTGMGIDDSIKNVVSEQYDKIFLPDYVVTFDKAMTPKDEEEFKLRNKDIIDRVIFTRNVSMDAKIKGQNKSVNLVVFKNNENIRPFIDLHDKKGKPLSLAGKGQCVVNDNLAKRLNLKVGDKITLTDSELNSITCQIASTCENYVYNYMYITKDTYEAQLGKLELNSALIIRKDKDSELNNISGDGAFIMKSRHVSGISITHDFRERINKMMDGLDYVVALVVFCAAALAFIVLYNLTNINITERIREIATIQVLGFNTRETLAYVFREIFVLTAISAVVGLPLGKLLHRFVMSQIIVDLISFDVHIKLLSYIISVLLTFLFSIIISLFMIIKIKKISMVESLKSIE